MTTTNAEEIETMIPICRRDRGQEPQSQGQVEHVSSPQHDPSPHTVNKLHFRDIQTIYYKLKLTIQRNMVRGGARLLHDPSPQTVNKPLYREIYTANCKYTTTQIEIYRIRYCKKETTKRNRAYCKSSYEKDTTQSNQTIIQRTNLYFKKRVIFCTKQILFSYYVKIQRK